MKQSRAEVHKRQERILSLLGKSGTNSATVREISRMLEVSEITVRRDLNFLEEKGALVRFHGGAMLNIGPVEQQASFETKGELFGWQKAQIAACIAGMVEENDTVFLNAGTTTLEIIRQLKDRHVRIVTNNAMAAGVVGGGPAELICTGGEYNATSRSYFGELSTCVIQRIFANLCILGVNGISGRDGITTSVYQETMLNSQMLERCRGKKIVAADASKIGRSFCFTSASIREIDLLVTDSTADTEKLDEIRSCGVAVQVAKE